MQNTRLVASNGLHAVLTHPCPNSPAQAPIYLPNLPQLYLIPTTFSDLPTPKPPQSRLSTNSIKHTRLIYNVCPEQGTVVTKVHWVVGNLEGGALPQLAAVPHRSGALRPGRLQWQTQAC